jgi:hypothetical protein
MLDLDLLFTLSWITVCLQPCQAVTIPRHATAIDQRDLNVEYDFVIAGAGPAGLTVADRLTEDPSSELSDSLGHISSASIANVYCQSLSWSLKPGLLTNMKTMYWSRETTRLFSIFGLDWKVNHSLD